MSTHTPIISPRDEQLLLASGLLSPIRPDGTHIIHKRLFDNWSNENYAHLPFEPISPATESTLYWTIPNDLISLVTLRHLGYNAQRASLLWDRWCNWSAHRVAREIDDPTGAHFVITFLQLATNHLSSRGDYDTSSSDNSEWYELMADCGIDAQLQNEIMDSEYKHIRQTRSCIDWLRDSLATRYYGLQEARMASRRRAMILAWEAEGSQPDESEPERISTPSTDSSVSEQETQSQISEES
ncbi:hypothetical protein F5B19DRAFT_420078 [Rostrohypoxylon terebratum]|nr:hypothetical protein F5B19DRAFT_420078 [Rostrohypoxylon terebratum]